MDTIYTGQILNPITEKNRTLQLVGGILAAVAVYWIFACVQFLLQGHTTLGTSSYGAAWGLAVANIVHIIGISVTVAIALIAWGVVTRDLDLAPVKWISGLTLLAAVPLERCIIRVGNGSPSAESGTTCSAGG